MSYYLSEAYSDLYNPRVDSYLNDNLRFIDYMQDEDIEEVVESVFWELRDYGNTLEEALDLLSFSASDEVITESYEELLQEFLTEASLNPYAPAGSAAAKEYQKYTTKSRRAADRSARIGRAVKQVRSRVDGGIARVKAGLSGAKGGMGRAAKTLGSSVSNDASEGKARLGQLLRRGVSKVQAGAGRVGRAYTAAKKELTGETGRQSEVRRAMRQNIRNVRAAQRTARGQDTSAFDTPSTQVDTSGIPSGPKPPVPPKYSERKYPVEPSSGQTTLFTRPVKGKPSGPEPRVPSGGQRKFGKTPRPKGGSKTRQIPIRF